MLTFKRVLAAWILWMAADLLAAAVLNLLGIFKLSGDAVGGIFLLISGGLLIACIRLSWAKIK